jgi:hypothetical protein
VTRHSFWPGRTARGCLIGDGRRRAKRWPVRSRAVRSVAKGWEGKSRVGGSFLSEVRSSDNWGPTHVGRRRPAATGVVHSPHGEHSHREQGRHAGLGDLPRWSNGNRPLTCGPGPVWPG